MSEESAVMNREWSWRMDRVDEPIVVYGETIRRTDKVKRMHTGLLAHRFVALVALFSESVRQKFVLDNRKLPWHSDQHSIPMQ